MRRHVLTSMLLQFVLLLGGQSQAAQLTFASLELQTGGVEKVDEYSDYNCEDEMAVLDVYAAKVQARPDSRSYIIVYGGQHRRRGEVAARMSRITHYLTTNRMIPTD